MPETTLPQGTVHHRETAGDSEASPVVFVHGFLVNHRLWGRVQDELERRGVRSFAPDLPLGAHAHAMTAAHDSSPRGVAQLVLDWLAANDLEDVTLVGNDTGGAICQLVLDADPSRIGRILLTNCDAFERFPPPPFDLGVKAARVPGLLYGLLAPARLGVVRDSPLAFGPLVKRKLPRELTREWVTPFLKDRAVRRETVAFLNAVDPQELDAASRRLGAFPGPALVCWAPEDRFFRIEEGRRLADTFADARLIEIPDSKTFVPLDQPARLADELVAFAQAGSSAGERTPAGM